jgi:WbqC-like protein family
VSAASSRASGVAERLVAIHQPNFLPWLGYFDKLARCDVFVLLDDVQFPKKQGTWMNRVRLLVAGEPAWITVPVVRSYHGLRRVDEMEIDESRPWRRKLLATIEQNYRRAPCFDETMPLVVEVVMQEAPLLARFNEAGVRLLAAAVGLDVGRLIRASTLGVAGSATDLLIALTRKVGGDCYLAGGGADGYQQDERFAAAGVGLRYQEFVHPTYPQMTPAPHHGLSIVDALMHRGAEATARLLRPDRAERTDGDTHIPTQPVDYEANDGNSR